MMFVQPADLEKKEVEYIMLKRGGGWEGDHWEEAQRKLFRKTVATSITGKYVYGKEWSNHRAAPSRSSTHYVVDTASGKTRRRP